jgi:hypothetical protein
MSLPSSTDEDGLIGEPALAIHDRAGDVNHVTHHGRSSTAASRQGKSESRWVTARAVTGLRLCGQAPPARRSELTHSGWDFRLLAFRGIEPKVGDRSKPKSEACDG